MKKTEVNKFINKIKAYYPDFYFPDEALQEWQRTLEPYDTMDVENKFQQHINGDYKDKPPYLHYITRYLKTPQEKERCKISNYLIRCNLCQREMYLDEYEEHYDKCLSIKYLITKINNSGKQVSYEELENLDPNTFDRVYQKYCDYEVQ